MIYVNLCNMLGKTNTYIIGLLCTILYGLCIGSFLNVVIYRLPLKESLVKRESHCVKCNKAIKWYDNIPFISFLLLRGKCRNCGCKISIQYPIVELLNTILWVFIYLRYGWSIETLLYFVLSSILVCISFIDEKTYEIPMCLNILIGILGIVNIIININTWYEYIIGAFCISIPLFIIWFFTNGMGFGDVKLMFFAGFLLGWKKIIPSFLIGCILAIIIHIVRMKISGKGSKLAFGPYLSIGIYLGLFIGLPLMNFYLTLIGM